MKNIKKIIALLLAIMSIMAIAIPAMAQTGPSVGSTAYTIKGDVAVRSSGEVRSDNIISRVNTGTAVTILQTTNAANGWYRVWVAGLTSNGYIREDCLGASAPQTPSTGTTIDVNKYMYCNVKSGEYVNIRSGPSKNDSRIGKLHRNDMVFVDTYDGTWAHITSPMNGYVMWSYLQETPAK